MIELHSLRQELRVAVRMLSKTPGATALSIVSIALGIGLTTAIFSAGDAMLLRSFPMDRPAELLYAVSRGDDGQNMMYGWPDYLDMASAGAGFADVATYERRGVMFAQNQQSDLLLAYAVSPNYFSVAGVKAALGQTLLDAPGGQPGVVLGDRLWRHRFGGDPKIAGRSIVLSGKPFIVTGVLKPEFTGMARGVANDVWVSSDAWFGTLGNRGEILSRDGQFEIIARVKPGITAESAAARLDAAIRGAGKHKPAPKGTAGTVLEAQFAIGWQKGLVAGGGLLAVLGLVLFVACANVSQLRAAQVETRRKELGLKLALGAGPGQMVRSLLVETALVVIVGAGMGILFARVVMEKLAALLSATNTFLDPGFRLDHRVLAFAIVAATVSVAISGLGPALQVRRLGIAEVLKAEQGATGRRSGWQRRAFIIGQLAASVMLFGAAILFVQSLLNASAVRPGFDPTKRLFVMNVSPGAQSQRLLWCDQACARLASLAGVRGATFARRLPLSGSGGGATVRVRVQGQAPMGVKFNNVGGNYFSLMGTRVLAGRGIDANDRAGSEPVAVITPAFARQFFSGSDPLGRWITVDDRPRQVVGIAEDGPSNDVHEAAAPFVYVPFAQQPSDDITLMVETGGEPARAASTIRGELKRFDPNAVVYGSTTLEQHMAGALSGDRMLAMLAIGLGMFGILLTAAGLFGVLQYRMSRRTREFGLRTALGASAGEIQRMVLGESLRMAAAGVPIGLGLLAAAAWLARTLVLGVGPGDPLIYVGGTAAALLISIFAAWVPARRATRVDPMVALRNE